MGTEDKRDFAPGNDYSDDQTGLAWQCSKPMMKLASLYHWADTAAAADLVVDECAVDCARLALLWWWRACMGACSQALKHCFMLGTFP